MQIELYFDFISPYAYLAWTELTRRVEERGDALVLTPVLFAGLLKHAGQLGPAEIPEKRAWLIRDTLRRAQRLAVDFDFPATHPFRPLTALRVSLAEVSGERQADVVGALFRHGWSRGGELGVDEEIAQALDDAGLDGNALVEKTRTPSIKTQLKKNTERAISRGVFGVPTMFFGDELFWGSDRVDDLFDHIDGRLHLDPDQVARALARNASATRKT